MFLSADYASRMAVNEICEREYRTVGVTICGVIHAGYVMLVGAWNVRENVRRVLRERSLRFDTLDNLLD